jgi:aryl-alcohol dehydrogenase-like predicted oxidoreductase
MCREHRTELAKLALQFSVATSPCATTVLGTASAANVRRGAASLDEPPDQGLLSEIDAILAPVRDRGWTSCYEHRSAWNRR